MKKIKELNLTVQEFKKLIQKIEGQGFKVHQKINPTLNGFNFKKPIHVQFINVNKKS